MKQRIKALFLNKNITGSCKDVLMCLTGYIGTSGSAWPSIQTLANRTGWSGRTVIRALKLAEDMGVIRKSRRMHYKAGRWIRHTNLYTFLKPQPMPERGWRPAVQRVLQKFLPALSDNMAQGGKGYLYSKAQDATMSREQMIAYCLGMSGSVEDRGCSGMGVQQGA